MIFRWTLTLNNQCTKFQCNVILISVFKMMLKIWSKLNVFTCCVSFFGEYIYWHKRHLYKILWGRHGRDRMVLGFTITIMLWLSPLKLWGRIPIMAILCDKVCQWLATDQWFSPCTPVSSHQKTDCHYTAEILLKVELNTIILTLIL